MSTCKQAQDKNEDTAPSETSRAAAFFLVFANRDPFSDKRVLSIGFTSSVTYHSVAPPLGLPRCALPALLHQSAEELMQTRFSDSRKWLPFGFPGSVAWEFLPPIWRCSLEMRSADRIESRFFVAMKWLPFGFPGSVAWEFLTPIWHGALEMTTFDNWPDLQSNSM